MASGTQWPVAKTIRIHEVRTEHIHVDFATSKRGRTLWMRIPYLASFMRNPGAWNQSERPDLASISATPRDWDAYFSHYSKEADFEVISCVMPQIVSSSGTVDGYRNSLRLYLNGSANMPVNYVVRAMFDSIAHKNEYLSRAIMALEDIGNREPPEIKD